MMSEDFRIERQGSLAIVRMTRAAKKNALTGGMYHGLAEALREADADDHVRTLAILGSDGVFTAGNDLGDFLAYAREGGGHEPPAIAFLRTLAALEKPLIAGVDGLAIGIGSTMLLHCDLIYASPGCRFQFPFVNLGVVPEAASSLLLPRLVGPVLAAELLMFGEPFDSARAERLGLVNAVVPADGLEAKVAERAAVLATKPRSALKLTKVLMRGTDRRAVAEQMALESRHFGDQLAGPAFAEAAQAFQDKRAPDFSGID